MTDSAIFKEVDLSQLPPKVSAFVETITHLCVPDHVYLCDGSQEEFNKLMDLLVKAGTCIPLSPEKRPGCFAAFTDPADTARAEKDTFICSEKQRDSGATNNWVQREKKMEELHGLFSGCMRGRTLYIVPFSMGPVTSPIGKLGVELTDSAYVAANMRIMTRMGSVALQQMWDREFVQCVHSVGQPIIDGDPTSADYKSARSAWPCNIAHRNVCQFPETREIWSFGSGYGGNSLLGKKCFALRIASVQARDEGWLAEHMLILGITNPKGEKRYIAAAFPSASGKTNLAMMLPSLPGWKIETVGDDIAWMRPGRDGRLHAINPEFGIFGVAPGTSFSSNPNAMYSCTQNSLFTNVGITDDLDVYWEGLPVPQTGIMDWRRRKHWLPALKPNFKGPGTGFRGTGYSVDEKNDPAAQANSRFTAPISQCPVLDPEWENPEGVPIDAIIFGGRRSDTVPLVLQSFSWQHGTFLGAVMRSQATSAADQVGLGHDPMAIRPFCGYNIKDYFGHWLSMEKEGIKLPKIFNVNWFQTDANGKFVWPGFGENIRVLEWVFNRCAGTAPAVDTPIGFLPPPGCINVQGLHMAEGSMEQLLRVDTALWRKEAEDIKQFFKSLTPATAPADDPALPQGMTQELDSLLARLA